MIPDISGHGKTISPEGRADRERERERERGREREGERGGEIPHSAKARAHSVCRSRTGRGGGNQLGWKRVREKLDALISNFHD